MMQLGLGLGLGLGSGFRVRIFNLLIDNNLDDAYGVVWAIWADIGKGVSYTNHILGQEMLYEQYFLWYSTTTYNADVVVGAI